MPIVKRRMNDAPILLRCSFSRESRAMKDWRKIYVIVVIKLV